MLIGTKSTLRKNCVRDYPKHNSVPLIDYFATSISFVLFNLVTRGVAVFQEWQLDQQKPLGQARTIRGLWLVLAASSSASDWSRPGQLWWQWPSECLSRLPGSAWYKYSARKKVLLLSLRKNYNIHMYSTWSSNQQRNGLKFVLWWLSSELCVSW